MLKVQKYNQQGHIRIQNTDTYTQTLKHNHLSNEHKCTEKLKKTINKHVQTYTYSHKHTHTNTHTQTPTHTQTH